MINHGLSTGALFLIVGMIYERRHTRMIADFGGLARIIPVFTACFMIVTLSSIGLPGLNGFVGEFLILVGTFQVHRLYAVLAAAGVILAAVYMLWMFQRVMFGTVTHDENRRLPDLTPREIAVLVPVLVFIVWIGVYPRPFLMTTEASVKQLLAQVHVRYRADDTGNPVGPGLVVENRGAGEPEPRGEGSEEQRHPQGTWGAGEQISGGGIVAKARLVAARRSPTPEVRIERRHAE
jgi:formate hydrogenlyase subunit 3/multisubunit Na+/H+ antiporter MnhD subunit